MSLDFTDGKSTFHSSNGLVLSGNKPLHGPVLTKLTNAIVSLGHNELNAIFIQDYRKISNISRTLVRNKIVDY